ncbi:MAG: IclR family transcriptional regulator [Rhodocyclales bacterium]|nr:IclR family transcriptional regulator [Rhodocyclales bacterium]
MKCGFFRPFIQKFAYGICAGCAKWLYRKTYPLIPITTIMSEVQSGVAAVDRALLILSAFHEEDVALSLALLARRTGLYKSTILRLLQSLLRAGYVVRLPDGNYVVGPEPARLARMFQTTAVLDALGSQGK